MNHSGILKNGKPDFENYLYRYIDFINKNDIKLFFELDIDSVVGLKEVERLRSILEKETGKKSIPVFHKSRGKDYFLDMIKNYNYVALGGIANKSSMSKQDYKYINWFCDEAHKNNCKIHGLGFTKTNLEEYNFDSVDSTAWTYGNRGKFIYEFIGGKLLKHQMDHKSNRLKPRETAIHNFLEWVKWSEYLEQRKIYFAGSNSRKYIYE